MTDGKASRQNRKAEKEAVSAALRQRRKKQLTEATSAIDRLKAAQRSLATASAKLKALANHLSGFYIEIDKLAKGKALLEVTPLMVSQANEVIRDAKSIIQGDTYLDRVKEFVPAGDNPIYPDVLVVMRAVRQSLERAEEEMEARRKRIIDCLTKANTIVGALNEYLETGDEGVPKDAVSYALDDKPIAHDLFFRDESGDGYFDFDKLDRQDLKEYLSEDFHISTVPDGDTEEGAGEDSEDEDDEA
jgi:hypothetical protein